MTRRASPHPAPWAREVESGLRSLKPPVGDRQRHADRRLLLGEDALGLAAVVLLDPRGQEEDGYLVKLTAVAIATRCSGCRYGDEAMNKALELAADVGFGAGFHTIFVQGWVHPLNERSKRMNTRFGLAFLDMEVAGQYEIWGRQLELPADD